MSTPASLNWHVESTPYSPTVGEQAHAVLSQHYRQILKLRPKVISDRSPEALHRLRIELRRMSTALQVFDSALKLPKQATAKRLKSLGSALGTQRDLDVLIQTLNDDFRPRINETEQAQLDKLITKLKQRRRKALGVTRGLLDTPFKKFRTLYDSWLQHPDYQPQADYPLTLILPALLSPLLSRLLSHPAWLLSAPDPTLTTTPQDKQLHELRKVCKQVRYQVECFKSYYGEAYRCWLQELRTLQESLGAVHDAQVLLEQLQRIAPNHSLAHEMPQLLDLLQQKQQHGLSQWVQIRANYLNPDYRRDLYQMILAPTFEYPQSEFQVQFEVPFSQATSNESEEHP